jgi:hypothetical protein
MLKELFNLFAVFAQMSGLILLVLGCFFVAAGIFSGRIGNFAKGGALIMVGGYLAGLANIPH